MSSLQHLRDFISTRLTSAAEEIFTEFEKTIVQYEEEIDRQRRLLDITWTPRRKLIRTDLPQRNVHQEEEDLSDQETNSSLDQKEYLEIKEEHEELYSRQEGEQFLDQETYSALLVSAFQESYSNDEENSPISESNFDSKPSKKVLMRRGRGKTFTNETNKEQHYRTNAVKRLNANQTREKDLAKRKKRPNQRRIQTDSKSCRCEKCGKQFSKSHLMAHMRTHTGERPFSCKTCGKCFTIKSNLLRHQKIHTGEKFSCETCGKDFTQRSALVIHRRIHTGETPYSCDICATSFRSKGNLKAHMKTHYG